MDRMTSTTCSSSSNPPPSFGTEAFLLPGNNNTRTRSSSLPGSPASSSPSKASSTKSPSTSSSSSSARKTNSLPLETVEYLKAWMMSPEHVAHPYPTEQEKAKIMADTGIELKQLTNWFVNNRKRFWKPRVEARLQQHEGSSSGSGAALATVVPPPTPGANNSNTAKASAPVGRPAPHLVTPTVVTPLKKVSSSSGIIALSDLTLGSALAAAGYGYLLEPQTSATSTTTTTTTTKLTPSSSSSSLNSSPARVSDHSVDSSASETDSVCSSSADEYHISLAASLPSQVTTAGGERTAEATSSNHLLTQTEYVNVHILRPSSHNNSSIGTTVVPTIDDVVVLHNVPADRVLKSFVNCPLTYSVPMQDLNNSHKIQICRDAEIAQLKALYLHQFLAAPLSNPRKRPCPSSDEIPATATTTTITATTTAATAGSPRPKFRRASLDVWREACTQSHHCYDDGQLPSLEEAAALFGFATS